LHIGYDGTEDEMREKSKRNITLLEKELETHGADPYIYYQLGQSYRKLHDFETAFRYLDLGLSMDVDPALDYVQNMVESYGYTLLDLRRNQDALGLLDIYDEFATRADFVFLIGLIYMNNGFLDQAINEFKKATTMEEFAVEGVNNYKAYYNIGVIYECTGYTKEAIASYRKCGDYLPAKARIQQLS
ncbi:MAG: glycosyl transferase family 2, partial [Lachnospiraceae bacterium]|nr:glycosyl transferase family 2 [Lachnospiraceae bacterium]